MGPQNGIGGADNYGTDLPQSEVPEQDITVERHMARFSKSAEFKKLKEVIQTRIDFHRQFSPGAPGEGSTPFRNMSNEERGWRTLVADYVIEELQSIINAYEMANEVVKEVEAKK